MEKKSNHYVPQFYLRNFSSNSQSIGMYNIQHNKFIKETAIRNQACKDYLYGEDGTLEDMFMKIETSFSIIIKRIIETEQIPPKDGEDYANLLLFLLLSEARNLRTADSSNALIDKQMKTLLQGSKDHNIPSKYIKNTKISLNVPNIYSISAVTDIYPILLDLECILLTSKTDRKFITSDNPLIRYNQMYVTRKYNRGYGLGNMGIQLFFPISPTLCICVFDSVLYDYQSPNEKGNIEILKGKQIDEINKLIYLNSYRNIFFSDKMSESYINRIISNKKHSNSDVGSLVNEFGSIEQNSVLITFSHGGVREKINMPIFKINKKYISMPLPPHMGGPMRPHAERMMKTRKERNAD